MPYRLKDRDLQKKIEKMVPDFSSRICNGNFSVRLFFQAGDVEKIVGYRPDAWNVWPGCEPPKDVPMRVMLQRQKVEDYYSGWQTYEQRCGYWRGYGWETPGGAQIQLLERDDRLLFRPWLAPDEKDEVSE